MRQRFRKCGIVVNDNEPEDDGGIQIGAHESLFACRATIYGQGLVCYVLDLRLISDSPKRVIEKFTIEADWEQIMVLDRGQRLSSQYVDWDAEEYILNDFIGKRFGPTLCKQGLLLGQGLYSPAQNRNQRWTSITVSLLDQSGNWHEQPLPVAILDFSPKNEESVVAKGRRKGLFELEDDAPAAVGFEDSLTLESSRQLDRRREGEKQV